VGDVRSQKRRENKHKKTLLPRKKRKTTPCPWDTHYQFSIKTLLSTQKKPCGNSCLTPVARGGSGAKAPPLAARPVPMDGRGRRLVELTEGFIAEGIHRARGCQGELSYPHFLGIPTISFQLKLSLCAASRKWFRHRSLVIFPPEGGLEFTAGLTKKSVFYSYHG